MSKIKITFEIAKQINFLITVKIYKSRKGVVWWRTRDSNLSSNLVAFLHLNGTKRQI